MLQKDLKQVGSYILSAIDMEETFANGVYLEYTKKEKWPTNIDPETYEKIQILLKVLINDTKKHSKIFSQLKDKLGQ
jgi:hypothetical protein